MCQCDFPKRGPRIGAGPGLSVILLIGLLLLITVSETSAQYQLRKPTGQAATASITITAPADGTTWETGKKYDITWNSSGLKGSVKIDLIAGNGKASPVARQTLNNGKYSFTVSRSIAEGDYKIRVSSADGKTVGESAGTIHVGKASGPAKKTAIAGGYQPTAGGQPTGGQQAGASGPTQATGTAGTVGGTPSGSVTPTGTAASAGTATRDPAQLHDQASASGTITQVGNLTPIQVPESDLQRREIVGTSVGLSGMTQVQASQNIRPNPTTITVVQPAADDFWVAGSPQTIRWNSSNLDGPVKIDLVHAVSAQQYDFYPVAASTNNTGSFNYMAPANLNTGPHNFYLQVATPDDQVKAFSPPFDVYHEAIDMTCKVVGLASWHGCGLLCRVRRERRIPTLRCLVSQ